MQRQGRGALGGATVVAESRRIAARTAGRRRWPSACRVGWVIPLIGLLSGCAFTTTARDWSGLMGADNKPTYYASATKVGLKLLVIIPFLGDMGISGLTRDLTSEIKSEGGNEVRIVEGTEESYFYGFPPFTWIVTPVISTVAAEYSPAPDRYSTDQAAITKTRERGWWGKWYAPWRW